MPLHIGLDLDNTIICYNAIFLQAARERGWISQYERINQADLKRLLIAADGDDHRWQWLQGQIYGLRAAEAAPFDDVIAVLRRWQENGYRVTVVSHKTNYSNWDPTIALRDAAAHWLARHKFVDQDKNNSLLDCVLFESSHQEKLARIRRLACDIFVDDKLSILTDHQFPPETIPVHFAPFEKNESSASPLVVRTWEAIGKWVELIEELGPNLARELAKATGAALTEYEPIRLARNNRVGRVKLTDGTTVIAKRYCRMQSAGRDTAAAEQDALQVLAANGVIRVPKPLFFDAKSRVGIVSDMGTRAVTPGDITTRRIDEAVELVRALIRIGNAFPLPSVGNAAEARLCLADYSGALIRRLSRLREAASDGANKDLVKLLNGPVQRLVQIAIERLSLECQQTQMDVNAPFPRRELILSPSDFGFHNTIIGADDALNFVDFEYFGWDDPAKLLADFVHHAGHQVSWPLCKRFVIGVCAALNHGQGVLKRWQQIVDLVGVEWLLIILNVVDPEILAQQRHANPSGATSASVAARITVATDRMRRMEARLSEGARLFTLTVDDDVLDEVSMRMAVG